MYPLPLEAYRVIRHVIFVCSFYHAALYAFVYVHRKEESMLLEDDIRLTVGLYGWKLSLRRLHPDNSVYAAYIYWRRRKHCLGLLGEVQCLSVDQLIALLLKYADEVDGGALPVLEGYNKNA